MQKLLHILSTVNAANVSKAAGVYTIREVCGATDGIVMNSRLYPAEQLAEGIATLEGKPAPAGHPKDTQGRNISALHGEALASAWIGSYCKNARHEGGRSLVDVVVNEAAAKAHPDGAKLVERLDAAIAGTSTDPIHVSTGLYFEEVKANGESRGKKYTSIVTKPRYDHLAILLNETGAGTPDEGVGLFLNAEGNPEAVEVATATNEPEDRRSAGLIGWIKRLVGNGTDVSFDAITSSLYAQMPDGCWIRDVFDRYAIWTDRDGKLWRQDYSVASDGSVAFAGTAVEVARKVEYLPITNTNEVDHVKETIVAALNAAGISGVAAMTDAQLLEAYNAVKAKPHTEALTAANSKLAAFELAANAAAEAELTTLATELATNTSLKPEDFKAMGLARCKELKASAKAAPIVVANTQAAANGADEFAGYDMNKELA